MITAAASNAMLDALVGAADIWVQLHTGDPQDGTANVAGEAGRAAATFDRAENGMVASNVTLEWTMTANSTVSHVSLWTDPFRGRLLWTSPLHDPEPVARGFPFTIKAGGLTVSLG